MTENITTNIVLFDPQDVRDNLLPMTFTRPIADLRIGIMTIAEKWAMAFPEATFSYLTTEYLRAKFGLIEAHDTLFVAGNIMPDDSLISALKNIQPGEAFQTKERVIAYRGSKENFENENFDKISDYLPEVSSIEMLYDIFIKNEYALEIDFRRITSGRESQPVSCTNTIIGNPLYPDGTSKIFIEEGAVVEGVYLNVSRGPIYIGRNTEIMEGSAIRAPFAACEHAVVNMCSRITGATTLGPYCKVGGELNNVVMIGYSNKAHDGFLGNAVIGEWCNIGGGTTASNLKNDYTEIKLWNYPAHRFLKTGLQFCGLIMGDHSKTGINCMFNTGTVVGVGVNIHGSGFPRNFVASFSEGSAAGFTDVSLTKFFAIAERMMARRDKQLSDTDREIFNAIYSIAENYK